MASPFVEIEVDDRVVRVSNPDRVYFPESGATKLDLVEYYLAVGPGIVNALRERPCMLHRFPKGVAGEKVHQKRVPAGRPALAGDRAAALPALDRTPTSCASPSSASVIWAVQMSTVEFHPWNCRRADTEKPDEWRIDLDPRPHCATTRRYAGSRTSSTRCSTSSARSAGPRRSGSKGMHVYVRIRAGARVQARSAGRRWRSPARSSAAPPTT